jgi:hypothetical protein
MFVLVRKLDLLFIVRCDDQYVQPAAKEMGMRASSARRLVVTFAGRFMDRNTSSGRRDTGCRKQILDSTYIIAFDDDQRWCRTRRSILRGPSRRQVRPVGDIYQPADPVMYLISSSTSEKLHRDNT